MPMQPFKNSHSICRLVTALGLAMGIFAVALGGAGAKAETLVIGTVGKDIKAEMKEHGALAEYLHKELASVGIDKVEVTILPTAAKMSDALKEGTVHLFFESPLVAAKINLEGAALPMLRRWRRGVAEYWSLILVPRESTINSLDDMRGRVIAFEDPDSTSGHLLPRALLRQHGLPVEVLKRPNDPVDPTKVGAFFSLSDKASILMLFDGRVDAIATDPQYLTRIENERPGSVRAIARSITVPRQVVMRSVKMTDERAQQVADVLARMNRSDEGRAVLTLFGRTDRFDAFPEGAEATFAPLYEQLKLLDTDSASATESH